MEIEEKVGKEYHLRPGEYVTLMNRHFYARKGAELPFRTIDMEALTPIAEAEKTAREYERFKGIKEKFPGDERYEKMHVVRAALGDCSEVRRFLDELKKNYKEVYDNSRFTLIDFSKPIIERAGEVLAGHGDKVEIKEGDVQELSRLVKDVFLFRANELVDDLPFCSISGDQKDVKVRRFFAKDRDGNLILPEKLKAMEDLKDVEFGEVWIPAGEDVKKWLEKNKINVKGERIVPMGGLRLIKELREVLLPGGSAVLHDYMVFPREDEEIMGLDSVREGNITHKVDGAILRMGAEHSDFRVKESPQGKYYEDTKAGREPVFYPEQIGHRLHMIIGGLEEWSKVMGPTMPNAEKELVVKGRVFVELLQKARKKGHCIAIPISLLDEFPGREWSEWGIGKQDIIDDLRMHSYKKGFPEFSELIKTHPSVSRSWPAIPSTEIISYYTLRLEKAAGKKGKGE